MEYYISISRSWEKYFKEYSIAIRKDQELETLKDLKFIEYKRTNVWKIEK
jgi:hypothetical protein